jgi:hypothetical protein
MQIAKFLPEQKCRGVVHGPGAGAGGVGGEARDGAVAIVTGRDFETAFPAAADALKPFISGEKTQKRRNSSIRAVAPGFGAVVPRFRAAVLRLRAVARESRTVARRLRAVIPGFRTYAPRLRAVVPRFRAVAPTSGVTARRSVPAGPFSSALYRLRMIIGMNSRASPQRGGQPPAQGWPSAAYPGKPRKTKHHQP